VKVLADSLQTSETESEPADDDVFANYCWINNSCTSSPAADAAMADESASGVMVMVMIMLCMMLLQSIVSFRHNLKSHLFAFPVIPS